MTLALHDPAQWMNLYIQLAGMAVAITGLVIGALFAASQHRPAAEFAERDSQSLTASIFTIS
jgi:hypothetical protein